jgi:hypothetical protein
LLHLLPVYARREAVASGTEMLGNRPICREKSLGMPWGLEALHPSLPLARGLMGVLGTVIEVPMLAMLHSRQDVALGGPIAFELVGDDDARHILQALEQLAEELLRRAFVPPPLHEDIQHIPALIHGPPEIVPLAMHVQEHLV